MKPAGNKELREQIRQIKNNARINYSHDGLITDEYEESWTSQVMQLITASNQQLLRELEGQAVEIATGYVPSEYKVVKAVPLSIIQDKLKGYGGSR
jgi:hypothetical protein